MLVRRPLVALAAALALTAGLSSCSDGAGGSTGEASGGTASSATPTEAAPSASASTSPYPTYVALGDSYTAAPGVPETETQSGCFRSSSNYPALVAQALGSELVDVSCSGASTLSLVGVQQSGSLVLPAQFDALGPTTSLVTLGIGGNDENLFSTLVGTCAQLAAGRQQGSPCRDGLGDQLLDKVATIRKRVTSAVAGVHDRAPDAEVLLVGYPQPVPARGTCPELPLARGDYAYVRSVTVALNDALRRAAASAGATFVDVGAASAGHDICAGPDAWVNGTQTDLTKAIAFHPFANEQQAVADLVLDALQR